MYRGSFVPLSWTTASRKLGLLSWRLSRMGLRSAISVATFDLDLRLRRKMVDLRDFVDLLAREATDWLSGLVAIEERRRERAVQ